MGDINALNKDRYSNLKIYSRETGKIVFKDYEWLVSKYEMRLLQKIVDKKGCKIFKDYKAPEISIASQ